MLLFTSLKSNKENVNLTCAVSFMTIIRSIFKKQGLLASTEKINHYLAKSLVKIHGNNLQGSGVMVAVQNKPYILTCSHVLDGVSSSKVPSIKSKSLNSSSRKAMSSTVNM